MPPQKYTRWRATEEPEEDGEEDGLRPESESAERGDLEDEMQEESRSAFTLMTSHAEDKEPVSSWATRRLICTAGLTLLLCALVGALIGYSVGSKSVTNDSIPNEEQATITNITTTPLPLLEKMHLRQNISILAKDLLSILTPQLIAKYAKEIEETPAGELPYYYIQNTFKKQGFSSEMLAFIVRSASPNHRNPNSVETVFMNTSISIVSESTSTGANYTAFSPYSINGSASSSCLVYAFRARKEDFELLKSKGVEVKDCILLVRAGVVHPSLQVLNAEERGAKGVILYPDPFDYGSNNTYDEKSVSPVVLPSDGIVWESLKYLPGDPSTPDYASQDHIYRLPEANYSGISAIPVQPISSKSAKKLFDILEGVPSPMEWEGDLPVEYKLGSMFKNGSDIKEIRLNVFNEFGEKTLNSIHAYHPSANASMFVLHIGCRYETHDERLSGSTLSLAALLAFSEAIGTLYPNGLFNQILFSAFPSVDSDSSVGYEYTQLNAPWIASSGLAYIDFDRLLEGTGFLEARVTPLLRDVLMKALEYIPWPYEKEKSAMDGINSAYSEFYKNKAGDFFFTWDPLPMERPRMCGESAHFITQFGMESVQLSSIGISSSTKYALKNSQYDTLKNIIKLDPDFKWTHLSASALGLVSLILGSQLPPVKFGNLATAISSDLTTFRNSSNVSLLQSNHSLDDIFDALFDKLTTFRLRLDSLDDLFNEDVEVESALDKLKNINLRQKIFFDVTRLFLRTREATSPSVFGSLLTYGPEPDAPCSGAPLPMVTAALKENNVFTVRQELSHLLSAISSLLLSTHNI